MALTGAERARNFKEKLKADPAKYAAYLAKQRQLNATRRKKVSDMGKREHKRAKKAWRERKQKERRRKRAANFRPPTPPSEIQSQEPTGNRRRGRRAVLKSRSACVRDNVKLKAQLIQMQQTIDDLTAARDKYKKRVTRLKEKEAEHPPLSSSSMGSSLPSPSVLPSNEPSSSGPQLLTPHSEAKQQLIECIGSTATPTTIKRLSSSKAVRALTFSNIVSQCFKTADSKQKKVISSVLVKNLATRYRKYRMMSRAGKALGLANKRHTLNKIIRREKKTSFVIYNFFIGDDVSRNTAGMKETVTRRKVKMQKRYLLGSMKKLYLKFKKRYPELKVSYTTFTRNRPFFVCKPTCGNRDTCLCQKHANISLIASKLKQLGVLESEDVHELVEEVVCSKKSAPCMYNECRSCKNKGVELSPERDGNETTTWEQWGKASGEKEKTINGEKVTQSFTVTEKYKITGSVEHLLTEFNKQCQTFKTHIYNIKIQNEEFKNLKGSLDSTTAVIQVDFSENFSCKLAEEVQSFHFGGSRKQVTIHTGVIYMREAVVPFSTISPSLDHGPHAIWAHLEPILKMIENDYLAIKILHFFSDGPSTQYRQKGNFYLFTKTMTSRGLHGTWSFFEAGHGKGAADGIGGALKRTANGLIANGTDIPDAQTFFSLLSPTSKIKMFFIPEREVSDMKKCIPENLQPVKGTFKIHQIVAWTQKEIFHRPLSCYCELNNFLRNKFCECNFEYTKATLLPAEYVEPRAEPDDISDDSDASEDQMSIHDESSPLNMSEIEHSDDDEGLPMKAVNIDGNNIKMGTYVLIEFLGGQRKTTKFKYVGVCRSAVDDGEVYVTFLNAAGENNTLFSMNENDESYVKVTQILAVLPEPVIKKKGRRIYYKFPASIDTSISH